ncbi:MAG: ABC transporter substrate-binding protein [Spirochaetales bacterium]|nr:ABC transporter substrate-binding protein [Spirochaetales bacterium]
MKKIFFIKAAGYMAVCILMVFLFLSCTKAARDSFTLTMFCSDINPDYDNFLSPVAQKIKEKTGVTLDIQYPVGDAGEKMTLMLASGEYPDLVYAKGEGNKFVQAGAYIDLRELIEKHGPNIKKFFGDEYLKRHRYSPEDPSIYWIGSLQVNQQLIEPGQGFQVQVAVLKELGYPEIKTVKDFERIIAEYAKRYPEITGKPVIPYTLCFDGWRILISVTNSAVFATGGNGDDGEWYVDEKTYKPVIHHTRPEEKEYFRWLNHMYATGLLDPECVTQTYDMYIEKISSGRVLGLSDATWEYLGAKNALKTAGMEERLYGIFPVVLEQGMENKLFMSGGYIPGWGIGITTKCKYPVRAIKFLDWLCTEEAQVLRHWGIEGEHWEIRDGKRVETQSFIDFKLKDVDWKRKTGVGLYSYPFPEYGTGNVDSQGYQYRKEGTVDDVREEYSDFEKEVLEGYGIKTTWKELFKTDYPVKKWGNAWQISPAPGTEMEELFKKVQDINWRRIPECIVCHPSVFDKKWDAYQEELIKTGVHRLENQYYELIRKRIDSWSN